TVERVVEKAIVSARRRGVPGAVLVQLEELRWSTQELRVSYFAQSLGTRGSISEERVLKVVRANL
ncbi:MAG TPA: DUF3418 domain-containing protein, partial [Acidimicrobiales bacterium]|nr:DUF3418 domain-containing protein [Acidimicrobiales bacterium]